MEMGFACKAGLFVMSVCVTLLILQQISSSLTSHQRNDMSPQWPAQHSTAQHSTAQHSTAQHSTAHSHWWRQFDNRFASKLLDQWKNSIWCKGLTTLANESMRHVLDKLKYGSVARISLVLTG